MPSFRKIGSIVATLALGAAGAAAGDWPQLQGPNGDGTVNGAGLPQAPLRLERLWKKPLGSGYSGISIAGTLAVTMHSDGATDRLIALETAGGGQVWSVELGPTYQGHDGSEDGPLSTPLIHDGRVFALSPAGELIAVNLKDGKKQWRVSLTEDLDARIPEYGFSTSPILAEGRVIVQVGGENGNGLCAFDPASGRVLWKGGDQFADYRTPLAVSFAGRTHLVTVGRKGIRGTDVTTGRAWWEYEADEDGGFGGVANIAPAGEGRFFVTGWGRGRLFEIVRAEGGFGLEERWSSSDLKGTYGAPVYLDGLLIGYSGDYLTAIDASNGERLWKSRPPGKGVPILIDGRLVIWAKGGTVTVGTASREGFETLAQADLLGTSSLTAPSFAGGTVFVRDLFEIGAVSVRAGEASTGPPRLMSELTAGTEFGKFLSRLRASGDLSLIDRYLETRDRVPIVERHGIVHFLYRGDGEDVGVYGSMTPNGSDAMQRVGSSDLFYRAYRLQPGSRVEYGFIVDFGELQPDALNPAFAPGSNGSLSELRLPGWEGPDFATAPLSPPRGTIQEIEITSEAMGDTRTVPVYLPEGYDASEQTYPLLIVMDIGAFGNPLPSEASSLPAIVDGAGLPTIVAYVPFSPGFAFWPEGYAGKRDDMLRFIADEMVGELSAQFRLRPGRKNRGVLGAGWGAFPALYAGVNRSDVFGHAAVLSLMTYGPLNEELPAILGKASRTPRVEFYTGWGVYDHDPEYGEHVHLPTLNHEAAKMLAEHRHEVTMREIPAGTGWGAWWAHFDDILKRLQDG